MRKVAWLMAAVLPGLLLSSGCHSPASVPIFQKLQLGNFSLPTGRSGGDTGAFSISFSGGTGPYSVVWDFHGGASPDSITQSIAGSPASASPVLSNAQGGIFIVAVVITDANGLHGDLSTEYDYAAAPAGNNPPTLELVGGAGTADITLRASDPDGDPLTVYAAPPVGMSLSNAPAQTLPSGSGEVTFSFISAGMFEQASDTAGFSAFDGHSASSVLSVTVSAGYALLPDTLYAIPLKTQAALNEPVTIVVATGVPAHPFQFLNGLRLTAPIGSREAGGTFNNGAVGGDRYAVDGFWAAMNPTHGFLLPPEGFFEPTNLGDGRLGFDFNVTPVGGHDMLDAKGALFNFELTLPAGVNVLGFQQVQAVDRTFYTDSSATPDRFWGDISNSQPGVPNSVTVE